jgi:hypothetical protein
MLSCGVFVGSGHRAWGFGSGGRAAGGEWFGSGNRAGGLILGSGNRKGPGTLGSGHRQWTNAGGGYGSGG